MDGQLFSDSNIPATTSMKPTVRRYSAARTARDLEDVRQLKIRISNVTALADVLIDWGAGNRTRIGELEAALHYPLLQFTARERRDIQTEIESCTILELACRAELVNVAPWVHRSSWPQMADAATRRDLANAPQEPVTGRSRLAR